MAEKIISIGARYIKFGARQLNVSLKRNNMKYGQLLLYMCMVCNAAHATELKYRVLRGHEARPYLRAQAELTVTILQDFPYCYEPDGGADAEDIDYYYERTYQRYFAEKSWIKHEPLIAYMANSTPLMRLWSLVLE